MSLWSHLRPCGPVLADAAGARLLASLAPVAEAEGWHETLLGAWPALAPVFTASPYLASLAKRSPRELRITLEGDADENLALILKEARDTGVRGDLAAAAHGLRRLKSRTHLLTALADLGGVWDLDRVTGALTRFADAALSAALCAAARYEADAGRLLSVSEGDFGPVPGYFCIAMGKFGAFELNYSSDIDYSAFYEPSELDLAEGVEPQGFAVRLTQTVAKLMQERDVDGYVFRVDLRLRPDPSATPVAVPLDAALDYYVSLGQNWERAAFIKARACAGDLVRGQAFLAELQPFIWRKNLDFAAIEDIHSIKRQIHIHKVDERLDPRGADLKLGRGGIREIEFYVQTQQLIHGGRDTSLRSNRTVDALAALAAAGLVVPQTAIELTESYRCLRDLEHRVQMIGDQQTHKLPESDTERKRVAALAGDASLKSFDARVRKLLVSVNGRYGELFSDDEDLSSRFGSLVFTGVEDDPETLDALKRMGFSDPHKVAAAIRSWHHGHVPATRSERGRELFTRLAPRLLEAAHDSGAPDAAFLRFSAFFAGLNSGVQVQSLFLAQPKLLQLIVDVLALAPQLGNALARRPAALDAMLDQGFFGRIEPDEIEASVRSSADRAGGFEAKMDAVRRSNREQSFRIGVQLMAGIATAAEAGPAFTSLAQASVGALAPAALEETERLGGRFSGQVGILALGKCGSGEMTATSDLDLVVVYQPDEEGAVSQTKGWWAETFYGRFTHRLISALSAPTTEGGLYDVDLKLRPFGADGPIATNMVSFEDYYDAHAETWEFLALTRARIVWATSEAFEDVIATAVTAALRRPREARKTAADVQDMRALMEKERPSAGFWDLKLAPGGLVDIEFVAQYLQLVAASAGAPLLQHTGQALAASRLAGLADPDDLSALESAWRLQQDLSQILKVAIPGEPDPTGEPARFKSLLARAGGARDFRSLKARLERERTRARAAYKAVVR